MDAGGEYRSVESYNVRHSEHSYVPLGCLVEIVDRMSQADKKTIHLLNLLLYSDSKDDVMARKYIARFRGFDYYGTRDLESQEKFLLMLPHSDLQNIAYTLHINISDKTGRNLVDSILFVCRGPFENVMQKCEDWSVVTTTSLDVNAMETENVFEDISMFLEEKEQKINEVKDIVTMLEKFSVSFKQEIDNLQKNFDLKEVCNNTHANFLVVRTIYQKLAVIAEKLSPELFVTCEEYWKPVTSDLLHIAACIHFFETEVLITRAEALSFLGLKENCPILLTDLDILFCWFKFFEDLGKLSEISLLNDNYVFPFKAYKILLQFMKLCYNILYTRDFQVDKKLKNLRFSLSKILTVIYNIKLRKNVNYFDSCLVDSNE